MTDFKMPTICAWCGIRDGTLTSNCEWKFLLKTQSTSVTYKLTIPICVECNGYKCKAEAQKKTARERVVGISIVFLFIPLVFMSALVATTGNYLVTMGTIIAGVIIWIKATQTIDSAITKTLLRKVERSIPDGCIGYSNPGMMTRTEGPLGPKIGVYFYQPEFERQFVALNRDFYIKELNEREDLAKIVGSEVMADMIISGRKKEISPDS